MHLINTGVILILISPYIMAKNCNPSPCGSGTCTMKRYGKRFKEFCVCDDGYTGKSCRWPCVDVYKSCNPLWKEEQRCQIHSHWTTWYDVNCPVTCNACRVNERTVPNGLPYPPMLEPIEPLLGIYTLESSDHKHWPVWFSPGVSYSEVMKFELAQVPMFGTPCLNYSSVATSTRNPNNIQTENGFVSVVDRWKRYPVGIGLMRVSNTGAMFWEEGKAVSDRVTFELEMRGVETLTADNDEIEMKHRFPSKSIRKFTVGQNYMDVEVTETRDGKEERWVKRYSRRRY